MQDWVGRVIRQHLEVGYIEIGRIVYIYTNREAVAYCPFPKGSNAKIPSIRRLEVAQLKSRLENFQFSLVEFDVPEEWIKTDEEMGGDFPRGADDRGKRHLWMAKRDADAALIAPILNGRNYHDFFELGLLNLLIAERALESGSSIQTLRQIMRRYFLGCGHQNALLPNFWRIGGKGTSKRTKRPTGRPKKHQPGKGGGYLMTDSDVSKLEKGYKKYKTAGTSEKSAFRKTCAEYYALSEKSLLPASQRPSFAQFKRAAKKAGLCEAGPDLGESVQRAIKNGRMGSVLHRIVALGQVGAIDSTCEDQSPVSEVNILKILPSTWRTVVVEVLATYILGVYVGHEPPSTMTSLLAILSAGSSKVEFCKQFGIDIEEDDWKRCHCKTVRGDGGEIKSDMGINTLNSAEISIEITRAYTPELKQPVEGSHLTLHTAADHENAGTTRDRRRARGEARPEADACRTMRQNMKPILEAILHHNNHEPVPELLTVEMRRDGVKPTRRAIYEWYVQKGYVVSQPIDTSSLQAQCLPRMKAKLRKNGVYLLDPRSKQPRIIPGLIYRSEWLASRRTGNQRRMSEDMDVLIDPNNLKEVRLSVKIKGENSLQTLHLKDPDPLIETLSLCDYLEMTDEDQRAAGIQADIFESARAFALHSNEKVNQEARKQKQQAAKAAGVTAKGNVRVQEKRKNRRDELELERTRKLGLPADFRQHNEREENEKVIDSARLLERVAPSATSVEAETKRVDLIVMKPMPLKSLISAYRRQREN
jgi:hypothetical protein